MKDSTEIVLVVDESYSMNPLRGKTIESVNSFIADQRKIPGEAFIQIVTFSDTFKVIRPRVSIHEVEPLTETSYEPNGCTALVDTLVDRIDTLGAELKARPESERPKNVIFVILTDGEENASKKPLEEAQKRIRQQTDVYKWSFLYLGAGLAAFSQGTKLGISQDTIASYNATAGGTGAAYSVVSASVTRGRTGKGVMFTSAEQSFLSNSK